MAKGMVDMIIAGIVLLVFSMILLVAWYMSSAINTAFTNVGISTIGTSNAKAALGNWDLGFVFLFIFMFIADIIGAFMVRSHPIFIIITLLFTLVFGVLAPTISNVYHDFAISMGGTVDAQFASMGFIMRNLSFFMIAISIVTSVVMYSKTRESPI